MPDDIKPPISGSITPPFPQTSPTATLPKLSGPSPLTPDIKIPPNLPTGEIKPLSPKLPLSVSMMPQVKTPPAPSVSPLGLKPTLPMPPVPQPGQPSPIFKSSIRTMQDDLTALKKGQLPAGFKIEKESEKEAKP